MTVLWSDLRPIIVVKITIELIVYYSFEKLDNSWDKKGLVSWDKRVFRLSINTRYNSCQVMSNICEIKVKGVSNFRSRAYFITSYFDISDNFLLGLTRVQFID